MSHSGSPTVVEESREKHVFQRFKEEGNRSDPCYVIPSTHICNPPKGRLGLKLMIAKIDCQPRPLRAMQKRKTSSSHTAPTPDGIYVQKRAPLLLRRGREGRGRGVADLRGRPGRRPTCAGRSLRRSTRARPSRSERETRWTPRGQIHKR